MNFFDRLSSAYKAFQNPSAQKSVDTFDWKWGIPGGTDSNQDLTATEYGAALAYTSNVAIMSAIQVWENWLEGKKWEIRDGNTDKVLVDSEMRKLPTANVPGARFYRAVKFYREYFRHSYFKSLAFSDKLYGESFVRRVPNQVGSVTALQWLNPLITEPQVTAGKIRLFRYSGDDGFANYYPQEIAYRIAQRDPDDDLRGQSPVLAAIDAANIEQNTKRALRAYFRNGMILGGLISPENENISLSSSQIAEREEKLQSRFKGVGNAFRFLLLPSRMNVEVFPAPDIEKNYSIIQPLRNEILMAMGVPPQLANDPSQVNYDNADDIKRGWWETWAIPYAKDIELFHNSQILPYLEPDSDCYFAFDLSPYEIEEPETVANDIGAGIIDIATAQEKRGYDSNPKLKGVYLINNVPMHEDVIAALARKIPSQYALDYANAQAASQSPNTNADTAAGIVAPTSPVESTVSEVISPYLTKKHDAEIKTMDDGSPIIEPPLPAELGSIHDGIPDDAHVSGGLKHSHNAIPFAPKQASPRDELIAWHKAWKAGLKRAFEPIWLRGDIADVLQATIESKDVEAIKSSFDAAFQVIDTQVKAIQETRLGFENDFNELLSRARAEKMGRVQWSSAMRSIYRRYGYRAYVDGMSDGGVEDDPTEDDLISINELNDQNSAYVTELGNVLYKEDGITDSQADIKAELWYNKSIAPYYQAGLLSADANGLYEWAYGDTEHCETCLRLNGQRHRLKGWKANYMPQGDNLDCHGFACKCNLVKVKGRARGNY